MKQENNLTQQKNYGFWAFLPIIVFLAIYLGSGLFFTILGTENSFKQIPRTCALVVALTVAMLMNRSKKLDDKMDIFCKAAGDSGTLLMCLIFLLAGAFSGVAKEMGGVESTVNLGLTFIPRQFIFAGVFLIAAFIATAMGTSMGTISAIGPIAVGLAAKADISLGIAIAAVVGGAMFGDNLSIISDTTIAATKGCGAEMRDKFKMNGIIAAVAGILTMVVLSIVGSSGTLTEVYPFQVIKVLPYIAVLVTAIAGLNVVVVLLAGIAMAGAVGLFTGSMTVITLAQSVSKGMSGMFEICIIALLLRGITGIVRDLGGIDWLVNKLTRGVKSRRGAEYSVAAMVSIFDLAIANNTIAILMAAPLTRNLAKDYNIAPKRVASLLDIFSCIIQGIIPHGGQILLAVTLTGLSPFTVIGHSYYSLFLALVTIATIQFGLLRTKEEKEGTKLYRDDGTVIGVEDAIQV